nr:DHHA1 domain-containing protein [Candidatus Sigynarchaeota archaeon]
MVDTTNFFTELEFGIAAFQDLKPKHVLSVSHNDGDGLTASALICKTMDFLRVERVQKIFERSESWENFFDSMMGKYKGIDAVFLTDLGAEEKQLCATFQKRKGVHLFILDHHKISSSEQVDAYPENVHSMNPTRFGLDGLRDIAGSTLTYLFCEKLSPRVRKLSWLPVVGMAGDILKSADKYVSCNKQVLDIALEEGVVSLHDGVAFLGGMAENKLQDTLSFSLLPFLKEIGGSHNKARELLTRAGIDPGKNVIALGNDDIEDVVKVVGEAIRGQTVLIAGKEGLLRHSFEYNFLVSIVGDKRHEDALRLLDLKKPQAVFVKEYTTYMQQLVTYLGRINSKISIEGSSYKFFELGPDATKQLVSDIASFTSVNNLLTREKLLVIAAKESGKEYKLSFRCTPEFVKAKKIGMGILIEKCSKKYGGRGGGHDLAGGWTMPVESYQEFKKNLKDIDAFI